MINDLYIVGDDSRLVAKNIINQFKQTGCNIRVLPPIPSVVFRLPNAPVPVVITLSDDLDCLNYYEGGLAICKKASESKGADYTLDLPFMKEHKWQFWLSPDVLSAIEKFPKYMKIMPQRLNKEKLDSLGIKTEDSYR